jgi:hypothetical protein
LEFVDEILGVCETTGVSSPDSPLMVDVEDERVKVFVRGARCVSFNSAIGEQKTSVLYTKKEMTINMEWEDQLNILLVSFHDIVTASLGGNGLRRGGVVIKEDRWMSSGWKTNWGKETERERIS